MSFLEILLIIFICIVVVIISFILAISMETIRILKERQRIMDIYRAFKLAEEIKEKIKK